MVSVGNHTKVPSRWGGWELPPFGIGQVPWEVASRLRDNPNFSVILSSIPDGFPIVDKRGVNLTLRGPVDIRDGYGSCSPFLAMALEKAGFYLHFRTNFYHNEDGLPQRARELLTRPADESTNLLLNMTWPPAIDGISGITRYGYTMFETDRIPAEWASVCNRVQGIFVPCQANADAFRQSGVTVPVTVAPLGVDGDLWPVVDRAQARENRPYTFGFFGTCTGRKNPDGAIKAFKRAFRNNKDVRFIWKTRGGNFGNGGMPALKLMEDDPRFALIDKHYMPEEILALLHNEIDCFVFPSRGEGFGLPPLQSMATGMPAIIAGHSGMLEYANDRYCYVVRNCPKVRATDYPKDWGDAGNWWEPDIDEIAHLMRHIYENREEAHCKGMAAASWVRGKFTWDETIRCIVKGMTHDIPDLPKMLQEHPPSSACTVTHPSVSRPGDMFVNVFVAAKDRALATANAINTTRRALDKNGVGYHFWLLDRGSTKESSVWAMFQEYATELPEQFTAIHSDEALGVGESHALLFRAWMETEPRPHECGMIIDEDIMFHDVQGFGRLCDALWNPGTMMVGCQGAYVPPQSAPGKWIACYAPLALGQEVDLVSGACQLFHRSMVELFGVPCNDLPGCEDAEWSLRARKDGYRLLAVGVTGFQHYQDATPKTMTLKQQAEQEESMRIVLNEYWGEGN